MAHDDLESTAVLLRRARAGDERARNALAARLRPRLVRFAHGRLPLHARGLKDTEDIVQETLVRAFNHLAQFEDRGGAAFMAYLHQILMNRLHDEGRRVASRTHHQPLPENLPDGLRSPLENVIEHELLDAYEAALPKLCDDHRNALMLRFEFDYSYPELADLLGRPSPNAARMVVVRALMRLIEVMKEVKGIDESG